MKTKKQAKDLKVGDVIEMVGSFGYEWLPITRIEASASGGTLYLLGHEKKGRYHPQQRACRTTTLIEVRS